MSFTFTCQAIRRASSHDAVALRDTLEINPHLAADAAPAHPRWIVQHDRRRITRTAPRFPSGGSAVRQPVQAQRTVHGRLALGGKPCIGRRRTTGSQPCVGSTSSTPDVVEAVNLTGSTSATAWNSQTQRPLYGICAAGVRATSRRVIRVAMRVAMPQISPPSVSDRHCQNRRRFSYSYIDDGDEHAAEVLGVKGSQVQILSSRREAAGQRPFRRDPRRSLSCLRTKM